MLSTKSFLHSFYITVGIFFNLVTFYPIHHHLNQVTSTWCEQDSNLGYDPDVTMFWVLTIG